MEPDKEKVQGNFLRRIVLMMMTGMRKVARLTWTSRKENIRVRHQWSADGRNCGWRTHWSYKAGRPTWLTKGGNAMSTELVETGAVAKEQAETRTDRLTETGTGDTWNGLKTEDAGAAECTRSTSSSLETNLPGKCRCLKRCGGEGQYFQGPILGAPNASLAATKIQSWGDLLQRSCYWLAIGRLTKAGTTKVDDISFQWGHKE